MIMVVTAAPRRVPATPKRDVRKAAHAEATPAATTWDPLTTGACLAASLTPSTLSTKPRGFKEKSVRFWRPSVGPFTPSRAVAPGGAPPLEFCGRRRKGGGDGGSHRGQVLGALRGDPGLRQEGVRLPGQGPAGTRGILHVHVRE